MTDTVTRLGGNSTPGGFELESPARKPWRLAPSDFAFLYAQCPYCFVMKVRYGRARPRTPFPSVFSRIDAAMKERYFAGRAEDLIDGLPAGVIGGSEWVKSEDMWLPGMS